MAEFLTSRNWVMQALFLALCLAVIFFHLLPLSTLPSRWAPPDLLICLALAWGLRRPDYVPILSLAGIMLLADLMYHRPPGVMAALVVLASEYLRNRAGALREASFVGEWLAVGIAISGITVVNRMILALVGVEQAALGLVLIQMLMSIAAYPAVVLVSQSVFGVRKLAPSQAEAQGLTR